jgi:hypothetical protein
MLEVHRFEINKILAAMTTVTRLLYHIVTLAARYNLPETRQVSPNTYEIVWPQELWAVRMDILLETGTQKLTSVTNPQPNIEAYLVMCAFEGLMACMDELEVYIQALNIQTGEGSLNCYVEVVKALSVYLSQLQNKIHLLHLQTNNIEPHQYINRQE